MGKSIGSKNETLGMIATLVASLLFGFSFLFTKGAVDRVSAFTLLSWRFVTALVVMSILVLCGAIKLSFRGKRFGTVLTMAIFQPVIYFIGESVGMRLTTASESGTIIAVIPIFVLIFSAVFLKERPTRLQVMGIVLSIAGVICIALVKGFSASLNPLGYAMLFVAVMGDVGYAIAARRADEFSSFEKTYLMAVVGSVVFTAGAVIEHASAGTLAEYVTLPLHDTQFLIAVLYLALGCQVAAFIMHTYGIAQIGANRSSSFAGITTLTSVLSGVLILGDAFSLLQGIATALILIGTTMANTMPKGAVEIRRENV